MSNTWQAAACASVNAAQKQGFAPRCCVCCVLDLGLFPIQRRGYAAVEMGKTLGRPVVRFHLAPHAQKRLTVSAGAPRASAGSAADEIYDLASRRAGPADFFVEVISSATSRSGGVPQRRRYAPGAEAADVHDASTSFVFIDVSPDMVARELRAWWPKLRSGGMMAGLGEGGAREAAEAFAGAAAEDCWLRLHRGSSTSRPTRSSAPRLSASFTRSGTGTTPPIRTAPRRQAAKSCASPGRTPSRCPSSSRTP